MTGTVVALLVAFLAQGPPTPYRRAAWPHWAASGCLNVRDQVLIAESRRLVRLSRDGCAVLAGEWLDIYTGELVTTPAVLDVDHVVSLAAAHRAGGWRWPLARRRAFANALDDPDHLVAVTRAANRAKADLGPGRWLPVRPAARCWYVGAYARIAERWGLNLPAADVSAIRAVLAGCES